MIRPILLRLKGCWLSLIHIWNQRFFFQFDYFGIQFQDIVFHVGQQGIVIQIVAEKERFTDPEVIDSGWHDLVGQQRNRDRRASGNIGDGLSLIHI